MNLTIPGAIVSKRRRPTNDLNSKETTMTDKTEIQNATFPHTAPEEIPAEVATTEEPTDPVVPEEVAEVDTAAAPKVESQGTMEPASLVIEETPELIAARALAAEADAAAAKEVTEAMAAVVVHQAAKAAVKTIEEEQLIKGLEKYLEAMKPGSGIRGEVGVNQQYALWKLINEIINVSQTPSQFKTLWNILLKFADEHKEGVFNMRYINRFAEHWAWSREELLGYQYIVNLIMLTANPATRAIGLRQVDIHKSLSSGFNEEARQAIIGFYTV